MTATVRVVVDVTRTYIADIDPGAYDLPANIDAATLVACLNADTESHVLIPGSHRSDGEVDIDFKWDVPGPFWAKK